MCGIFGYRGTPEVPGLLERMALVSRHRGPDDAGTYEHAPTRTRFGFCRLSIIDLSTGGQPMSNEAGDVWIVCNGEIYNFVELREDLATRGHQFRSTSDVEVLVHLYEERGLDFLDDVNGMFGLALHDRKLDRLVLARDRLGIKPLYYAWDGRRLAWSSEIKPILACPWISPDPDWRALSAYLHLNHVPGPWTGFEGVRKLPAGSMAIHGPGALELRSYWHPGRFLRPCGAATPSFEEASERLQTLLADACRLQLRSDVPVSALLSGGLDSSAVVALARRETARRMEAFTVYWEDAPEKMDERDYARLVAQRFDCIHRLVPLRLADFGRHLPGLAWHLDEPLADGAYVPTWVVSRIARQSSKVILTGVGGDELFAGYSRYRDGLDLGALLARAIRPHLWRPNAQIYADRAVKFPWRLLVPTYRAGTLAAYLGAFERTPRASDALNRELAFDLGFWLQDDILLLTDKMTMAASLEARVPLLDHRLVEFVLGLPSSYKLRDGRRKALFQHALRDVLPPEIHARPKDGFGAPILSWMQGEFLATSLGVLGRGELVRERCLRPHALRTLGRASRTWTKARWAVWMLLGLELWFRFARGTPRPPEPLALQDL